MKRLCTNFLLFCLCTYAVPSLAITPDAGSILRGAERPAPQFPDKSPDVNVESVPTVSVVKAGPKVFVKVIRIVGATIFKEAALLKLLHEYTGRELTYGDIEKAAAMIAAHYSDQGYIVKVILPPQNITDGIVLMYLVEGKLGNVKTDPLSNSRFNRVAARQFITNAQPVGQELSINKIERGLLLLNDIPGISASSSLEPGEKPGTANLILKMNDLPRLTGSADLDNFGDRSTGEYRLSANLNINNPYSIGDQIDIRALSSIASNYMRLGYNLPLGASGARLSTSLSYLHYELGGDFKGLDGNGDSVALGASLVYPFIRNRGNNLYFSIAYDYRSLIDNALGVNTSNRGINVGNISLSGNWQDSVLGGGLTSYGSSLAVGSLARSGAPNDLAIDQASARSDGAYSKVQINMSRLQRLSGQTSLFINLNSQYAAKNLDSSEKFSLCGVNGIRAYPSNEATGDHGMLITSELRQNLTDRIQVAGFYDFGWIQLHKSTWPGWNNTNGTPNSYTLDGVGIAVLYALPGNFLVKGTVATRLSSNPAQTTSGNDSDGTKREPRFWMQVNKSF